MANQVSILNGGYWSVANNAAYQTTRACQRITPTTKLNRGRGYRPVKRIANQAMKTQAYAAMSTNTSTMMCGMTRNHFTSGNQRFRFR